MLQEPYYWMIFYIKKVRTNDQPYFNSYLLISMLAGFNILTVIMLISYLFNINIRISFFQENSKIIGIFFGLSVMVFNYFYLFRQREKIVTKYSQLSDRRKTKGQILFWVYAIGSLFLIFFIGVKLFPTPL